MLLLYDIILFYGFQFNDFWSTILAIRKGAHEVNPVIRPFVRNPFSLLAYKFGGASSIFLIYFIDPYTSLILPLTSLLFFDTLLEGAITAWNIFTIWKWCRRIR